MRQYRIVLIALKRFTHTIAGALAAGISDQGVRQIRGTVPACGASCHDDLQCVSRPFSPLHNVLFLRADNENSGPAFDAAVTRQKTCVKVRCPGTSSLPGKISFAANDPDLSLSNSAKALSAHLVTNPGG